MESEIAFVLNGADLRIVADPTMTLLELLRDSLGLKGTKHGCGRGECGACTVLLNGKPVSACLVLAGKVSGQEVVTIEGLARGGRLHPIQEAFIEHSALQCGYCGSGMMLSAKALLDGNPSPSEREIREAISGNLCRCTGYHKIIKAISAAAEKLRRVDEGGQATWSSR